MNKPSDRLAVIRFVTKTLAHALVQDSHVTCGDVQQTLLFCVERIEEDLTATHEQYAALKAHLEKKASTAYVDGFNEGAERTAKNCGKAAEVLGRVEKVIREDVAERVFGIAPATTEDEELAPRRGVLARLFRRERGVGMD